jgi:hypothetical protein
VCDICVIKKQQIEEQLRRSAVVLVRRDLAIHRACGFSVIMAPLPSVGWLRYPVCSASACTRPSSLERLVDDLVLLNATCTEGFESHRGVVVAVACRSRIVTASGIAALIISRYRRNHRHPAYLRQVFRIMARSRGRDSQT